MLDSTYAILGRTLRARLTRETDDLKTRLGEIIPKEHEAYHAMWKAIDAYFRALQNLEVGEFSDEKLKKADEYSDDALGKSLLTEEEDCNEYYNFLGEVERLRSGQCPASEGRKLTPAGSHRPLSPGVIRHRLAQPRGDRRGGVADMDHERGAADRF